ncbi:MAG: LysR family transcriptional regulator [Pseudomonadota bacterium]
MNFNTLDLNLLLVFDALMRTRSVTLAGEKIGLSQSATSNSLQRLRDALGDPLFVRTSKGMEPSALAMELEAPIRATLEQLRATLERTRVFDPATATRTFKVLMSDIAQMAHMPLMVSELRRQAPGVSLENIALPLREAKEALVSGELDIAMGFLPDLGADFHRQSLFAETWTCVISNDHPSIDKTLTEAQYMDAMHIVYHSTVSIHSILDQLLVAQFSSKGIKRKIGLTVPYWSGLASTVAASDLILTAPVGPALSMTKLANVRIVPLPFDLPAIDLCMQWHTRMHRDPANQWFRNLFATSYRVR